MDLAEHSYRAYQNKSGRWVLEGLEIVKNPCFLVSGPFSELKIAHRDAP